MERLALRNVLRLGVTLIVCWGAGGCASRFAGEWVEEVAPAADEGPSAPAAGRPPMAIKFIPPATVRVGSYMEKVGVVDPGSVQSNQYFEFEGGRVAHFGALTARAEGDRLRVFTGTDDERMFVRFRGPSIFPPLVQAPPLVQSGGGGAGGDAGPAAAPDSLARLSQ